MSTTSQTKTKQVTTRPAKLKYAAYTRKSSESQERQSLSIPTQQEKVNEYFSDLDVEFLQEEKSAFMPDNRPVFSDMIRRLESGEIQGIIAWHPDRLSRNEIDAAKITYLIRTGVIKDLKFCTYTFENTPEGIWMLQMALSQSQYDSAKKGRDVKRGLEKKVKMGCPPGVANCGYLNDKSKDRGERDWLKDPDRFDMVKKMWEMFLTGLYSPPQVLKKATEDWGFRTVQRKKQGGVPLSNSTIYKIFSSIKYAGYFYHGEDGVLHKGSYEPMITIEEFDKAQRLLGRRGRPRPKTRNFAYVGTTTCGECGASITAEVKTKNIKITGLSKDFTYYHCTHRKKYVQCSQKGGINEIELERQVDEMLAKVSILPEFAEWAVECLESDREKEVKTGEKIKQSQQKELTKARDDLDSLKRAMYRQQIDEDFFKKEKAELDQRISFLEDEVGDADEAALNSLKKAKEKFEFAVHARHHFKNGNLDERRSVMHNFGSNWQLKDKIMTVEPDPVYVAIEKDYPKLEAEYRRLEPALSISPSGSKVLNEEAKTAVLFPWLRRSDSNRRPID